LCKVFNTRRAIEASQPENEVGDEMRVYDKETYIDKYLRKWRRKLKRGRQDTELLKDTTFKNNLDQ